MLARVSAVVLVGAVLLAGCSDKLSFHSASFDAPDFSVSPGEGDATTTFHLAAGSWANGLDVAWDFGDGTSAHGATVDHAYGFTNGAMTITMIVTKGSQQHFASRTIKLGSGVNAKPSVSASASRNWAEVGRAIDLSAYGNDRDGDPLSYLWTSKRVDAGPGQETVLPGNGTTSSVTFDAPGKYAVTVRARDPKGLEATDAITIDVSKTIPDPVFELKKNGTLVAGSGGQKQASEQLWVAPPPAPDTNVDAARYQYTLKYPASTYVVLTWNDTSGQGADDLDLELRNADTNKTIFTSQHHLNPGPPPVGAPPFEFNFTMQEPGNYTIVVRAVTGAQIEYALLVHCNLLLTPELVAAVEGS